MIETTQPNDDSLLKSFISFFTNEDFFIDIIKIGLYPSDFGVIPTQKNSFVEYVVTFLRDLVRVSKSLKIQNSISVSNYCKLCETILNIREYKGSVINYDNVGGHVNYNSLPIPCQKILHESVVKKVSDAEEFKNLVNEILNKIQAYYEIDSIKINMNMMDTLKESISSGKLAVFEALKVYRDQTITQYNDLSKLQSINKKEKSDNWFVISDKKSCNTLAKKMVSFVEQDYNKFKTGFDLLDQYIKGFESSSVHVLSAPSNNGKSIFLANLCHSMLKYNIDKFQPGDTVIFLTMED